MNDDRLDAVIAAFYRDTVPAPPDPQQRAGEVMVRVRQVRQRSRWWPLPVFERPAPTPTMNGRTSPRGFAMFSALKLMVASVILALFGGFLLAGVLGGPQQSKDLAPAAITTSPTVEATVDPTEKPTTPALTDLLPSVALTVEEVRPGMFHVLGDDVRDLSARVRDVTVDAAGDVWVELGTPRKWRIVRLGEAGPSRQLKRQDPWDLDVTADGRPSIDSPSAYRVFDGTTWVKSQHEAGERETPDDECEDNGFTVDGECWWLGWPWGGLYRAPERETPVPNAEVGLADDSWPMWGRVTAGDDNGWVFVYERDMDFPFGDFRGLLGYDRDGWTWNQYQPPDGIDTKVIVNPGSFVLAPDGTLWLAGLAWRGDAYIERDEELGLVLISWDGKDWATYGPVGDAVYAGGPATIAPDGSVWYGGAAVLWEDALKPVGLAADAMAFATDGTAWVATGGGRLYAVIPEELAPSD